MKETIADRTNSKFPVVLDARLADFHDEVVEPRLEGARLGHIRGTALPEQIFRQQSFLPGSFLVEKFRRYKVSKLAVFSDETKIASFC